MSTYKYDCAKCTNKKVNFKGEEWCREISEGRNCLRIASGTTGKDFVFECNSYTLDPKERILKVE